MLLPCRPAVLDGEAVADTAARVRAVTSVVAVPSACVPRGQDADQVATALAGDVVPAHRPRSRLHGRLVGHGVPGAVQSSRRTHSPLPLEHRPGRKPMSDLSSALYRAAGARRAPEPHRRARVCCCASIRRCTGGCGYSPYRKTPPCSSSAWKRWRCCFSLGQVRWRSSNYRVA